MYTSTSYTPPISSSETVPIPKTVFNFFLLRCHSSCLKLILQSMPWILSSYFLLVSIPSISPPLVCIFKPSHPYSWPSLCSSSLLSYKYDCMATLTYFLSFSPQPKLLKEVSTQQRYFYFLKLHHETGFCSCFPHWNCSRKLINNFQNAK